ncbi:hypothetical protein NE237_002166 [Protea cynaroides]|uniref:Wound-responsive family protein n=1 Tax=Protea cynaroides TaxID=273540 RepID=A0A9Q0KUQ0_9MAGN|nr:hypothetical protein NE237_002166 [Protea cynaroides]
MGSTSKAWIVAASIGAVEALKDQGFCRWNYAMRSFPQHVKNNQLLLSQINRLPSSFSAMAIVKKVLPSNERLKKQSESGASDAVNSLKKTAVLDEREKARKAEKDEKIRNLICWGPNN